jgi:hypothetical protein
LKTTTPKTWTGFTTDEVDVFVYFLTRVITDLSKGSVIV